jgi:hypothetical protein
MVPVETLMLSYSLFLLLKGLGGAIVVLPWISSLFELKCDWLGRYFIQTNDK